MAIRQQAPRVFEEELERSTRREDSEPRYLNRDASWLDFNRRVLARAGSSDVPVLERARFLAISAHNLDEFFQVRGAVLAQNVETGLSDRSPDGLTPLEQRELFRERTAQFARDQDAIYASSVAPALQGAGICVCDYHELDHAARSHLDTYFALQLFPVLTPLAVDPAYPFPYISSMSLNLAVVVADPLTREHRVARVKVPPALPRFAALPAGNSFVPLEQVISAHLDALFPGMDIITHHPFRLTRGADFQLDSDEDDLLEAVRDVLKRRRLSPLVVRLEIDERMPDEVRDLLIRELEMDQLDVHVVHAPLDLSALFQLAGLDRPELKYQQWVPSVPAALLPHDGGYDIFAAVRAADVLVHHPYEDFDASAVAFVEQAASDPSVLAIKQTLYRTSGTNSPIIRSLIRAAETGKQVVALVELTARFDEQANISWAQALEQAGVHVIYGIVGLKTHAKVSLVVRTEAGQITRYCHVSTGNYNPDTARIYEDVALLTSDAETCADMSELFNALSGYSRDVQYSRIIVAPQRLRGALTELIHREARPGGRIALKLNGLIDPEIIDALYEAAETGAEIDLIVRGMCALNPAASAAPERLRIRSLVGRYLEHSRIYRFGIGADADYLISSADLMPRNLDRRVEVAVPVTDSGLRGRLDEIIELSLTDDALAWQFDGHGWTRVPVTTGVNAQEALAEGALRRNRGVA
ncbi:MAG: polyphosphate kinase 1 [Candidatus Dormibacteraeota bacterium]|uniref:Polyphosphate kinase n=1 Tax=Candidatus Amunia macphersoniae TaxID=3127014 RepID=A0A934KLB3_9BACT|nr:polyphosphate kinase 1 [Candidatus Dormibacteraeota bacterium]